MITYQITDDYLIISLKGWDKIWSLKGTVKLQRSHIQSIRKVESDDRPPWLRAPGTYVANVMIAGTYYGKDEENETKRKEFWCTRCKGDAVVINLSEGADFTRVVTDIDVENMEKLQTIVNH